MIWILISYAAGSIPFGILVARAASGKDVRTIGSGNIGATNVARAAGRGAAGVTLLLDAAKGLLPVVLAPGATPWLRGACAVAAVTGHCFPVWLGFRGGKGVATGLGVGLALAPWAALAGAACWAVAYKLYRISSIGSLCGVATCIGVAALTADRFAVAALGGVAVLVVARHSANIRRLLRRQEP